MILVSASLRWRHDYLTLMTLFVLMIFWKVRLELLRINWLPCRRSSSRWVHLLLVIRILGRFTDHEGTLVVNIGVIWVRGEWRQEKHLVIGNLTWPFHIRVLLGSHLRVLLGAPKSTIGWLALLLLGLLPAWNLLLISKHIIASTRRAHHSDCELFLSPCRCLVVVHQYIISLLSINDLVCLEREVSWILV